MLSATSVSETLHQEGSSYAHRYVRTQYCVTKRYSTVAFYASKMNTQEKDREKERGYDKHGCYVTNNKSSV